MRGRIMIVEDDLGLRNLYATVLARAGYEVLALQDIAKATQKIVEEAPDVIVIDQNLSGFMGTDIIRTVRQQATRQPRIVMITSKPSDVSDDDSMMIDIMLHKSTTNEQLIAVIDEFHERDDRSKVRVN